MANNIISFFLGIVSSLIAGPLVNCLSKRFYGKIRFTTILKGIDALMAEIVGMMENIWMMNPVFSIFLPPAGRGGLRGSKETLLQTVNLSQ